VWTIDSLKKIKDSGILINDPYWITSKNKSCESKYENDSIIILIYIMTNYFNESPTLRITLPATHCINPLLIVINYFVWNDIYQLIPIFISYFGTCIYNAMCSLFYTTCQ